MELLRYLGIGKKGPLGTIRTCCKGRKVLPRIGLNQEGGLKRR